MKVSSTSTIQETLTTNITPSRTPCNFFSFFPNDVMTPLILACASYDTNITQLTTLKPHSRKEILFVGTPQLSYYKKQLVITEKRGKLGEHPWNNINLCLQCQPLGKWLTIDLCGVSLIPRVITTFLSNKNELQLNCVALCIILPVFLHICDHLSPPWVVMQGLTERTIGLIYTIIDDFDLIICVIYLFIVLLWCIYCIEVPPPEVRCK